MHVAVDGSFNQTIPDLVSAGVAMMDETGFITEKYYKTKHIEASSTFAEWYAVEKAIDTLIDHLHMIKDNEVFIYTDYTEVVRILKEMNLYKKDKDIPVKNNYLQKYILFILSKVLKLNGLYVDSKRESLNIQFRHIQEKQENEGYIIRLHKKAHQLAKINTSEVYIKSNEIDHEYPIRLNISLKSLANNDRKWVLSENGKVLYTGKLKKIIVRYHNERYNIISLMENKQLRVDKQTSDHLIKFLPSLTE